MIGKHPAATRDRDSEDGGTGAMEIAAAFLPWTDHRTSAASMRRAWRQQVRHWAGQRCGRSLRRVSAAARHRLGGCLSAVPTVQRVRL